MKSKYIRILIAVCGLVASGVGVCINSTGVFYYPASNDLNMNQGTFSMYETLEIFTFALLSIPIARIVNNGNFRKMIITGTLISSVATAMMGLFSKPFEFYAMGILIGIGKALFYNIIVNVIVNNWFISNHGLIMGAVLGFSGIGGAIFSSFFSRVIRSAGWRMAYVVMGAMILILNLPAILFRFSLSPVNDNDRPYVKAGIKEEKVMPDDKKYITCTPAMFVLLIVACFLATGLTGFSQNLPAYIESVNYSAKLGAMAATLCQVGNVGSKVVFGYLSDRIGPAKSIYLMILINTVSVVLLYLAGVGTAVYAGPLLFGSIYAVSAVAPTILIKNKFGPESFKNIFPYTSLASSTGVALSVSLFGYIFAGTGSFNTSFLLILSADIIIAVIIFYLEKKYEKAKGGTL